MCTFVGNTHCISSLIPVMFIIRENLSDLVQIILQITRGVDLRDEGQKSASLTPYTFRHIIIHKLLRFS